jgi:hypothetical protein
MTPTEVPNYLEYILKVIVLQKRIKKSWSLYCTVVLLYPYCTVP